MEGTAQTVLSTAVQLVGQEFRQLRAVRGEVTELRDELATMNTLLRMQSEEATNMGSNHFVREWMKQLRELAYDSEDCIDLYLFRIRCRTGDGLLLWSKRIVATLFPRHRLAGDITALRLRAVAISERHSRYGVSLELLGRRASSYPAPLQAVAASPRALLPDNDTNQFIGMKDQAKYLANKVVNAAIGENDEELKVFSIVGFGGTGKITLAMEVCRQLETVFDRQAKVSASEMFGSKDLERLLKSLLRQVVRPDKPSDQADLLIQIDMMNLGDLELKLGESLQNQRYLILIDNVRSTTAWDAIRSRLPSNNYGSRIIVTTPIANVAKECSNTCDHYIHYMKNLCEKESIMLFLRKVFGSTSRGSCPEDLERPMFNILRKCAGLPLAIVGIASLLSSYKHKEGKEMWEIVDRSIDSQMLSNTTLEGMRQILTLIYDHLPYHLKGCVMYLCIFPEDYVICKDRLLKRWIAEGLIPEKLGMTQMDLAETYFNELVSRSIIDRGTDMITVYQWREETCRVHGMMLEAIVSKALESNFVSLVGGKYEGMSYERIRRLTIHVGVETPQEYSSRKTASYHGTRNSIKEMIVQHVRSLSIFDPEAHKLLARLGEFTLLRVLDLENCKGLEKKHMRHICRMYLLRFLSLRGTDIKVMPSRIGDLEHLQTLDVRQTQLTSLPKTVTNLVKMEDLLFSRKVNIWSGWMLPQGIKKMKALCRLNKAVVMSDEKVAKEIGELDQLEELCIYTGKAIHPDVPKELARSLSKMYSLQWLDIGSFGCENWPCSEILEFLHEVESPPLLLRYFRIRGYFEKLPEWVGKLTKLIEFDIAWAHLDGDQLFNVLCTLRNLQRLTLGPYFIKKEQDMVARSSQSFPELKELTLGYSPETPKVYKFEEGSMPKLETLVLNYGDQANKIVGIEHLTNLKEVQINTVSDCPGRFDALEVLKVENEKRLASERELIRVIVR